MGGKATQALVKLRDWTLITVCALIGFPLGLLIIASIYFHFSETFKTRCANYDELVDSGLMGRGWLPDTIPKSVYDLRERHNVESNEVSATFYIAVEDVDELVQGFSETTDPKNKIVRIFVKDRDCSSCLSTMERLIVDTKSGRVQYEVY